MTKLNIGKISYTNLFPIFFMLQNEFDCSDYVFYEGVPSDLNKKLREGEIDVSPSSSIEYLRNDAKYNIIDNHSISSKGPVKSIFLFSHEPIERLNGLTILTSSQSETSVALLKIILNKFIKIEGALKSTSEAFESAMKSHVAYMLIGDEALFEALKKPKLYTYDLGELWNNNTALPFTFALWLASKDCCTGKTGLFERFVKDLNNAKELAMRNLNYIAARLPLKSLLAEEEILLYWKGISFDFGEEHREGFKLFRQYSKELGIL